MQLKHNREARDMDLTKLREKQININSGVVNRRENYPPIIKGALLCCTTQSKKLKSLYSHCYVMRNKTAVLS